MKIVFLILLLVSVVYSTGFAAFAYPKCGTIQEDKCKAFGVAVGKICICKKTPVGQYKSCTEYGDQYCANIPTGTVCNNGHACPPESPASLACADYCSKMGAVCNRSAKKCGSFQTLNA